MPHDRPMTTLTDAQRHAGRVILSGVICLHVSMLIALPGLALYEHPIGWLFLALAALPKMAWLPVLFIGILARLSANREAARATADAPLLEPPAPGAAD